jgi:tellurite methyltransferase
MPCWRTLPATSWTSDAGSAISLLQRRARSRGLAVDARVADLRDFSPEREYDCIVSIGLLMFLRCLEARSLVNRLRGAVRDGGVAAINVLVEGTSYMDMFDPAAYCLFGRNELAESLAGWRIVLSRHDDFPAPGGTQKKFHTIVARRAA